MSNRREAGPAGTEVRPSFDLPSQRAMQQVGTALIVIVGAIAVAGPQETMSGVCSTAMYGYGWLCFFCWFFVALVSMPWRVRGSHPLRGALHALGWTIAWLWWVIAIALADLLGRADLLWCAYLITGAVIALWRTVGHGRVLSWCVREALRADALAPGALALGDAAIVSDEPARDRSRHGRMLHLLAGARALGPWREAHLQLFGATGQSGILLTEAMLATDRRAAALRAALRLPEPSAVEPLLLFIGAVECETRLAIALRRQSAVPILSTELSARLLAAMELLVIASQREDAAVPRRALVQILRLAADERVVSEALPRAVERLFGAPLAEAGRASADAAVVVLGTEHERSIVRFAEVAMLCRHRLYRPAKGVLGQIASQASLTDDASSAGGSADPEASRVERVVHAITSEIEYRASAHIHLEGNEHPVESLGHHRDLQILTRRHGAAEYHGRRGCHPGFSNRAISPSEFAVLPLPQRPREIGVGIFAAAVAGCLWAASVWLPAVHPLSSRLQVIRDVPFGGRIVPTSIRSAAIGGTDATRAILLADAEVGIQTLDLSTFRSDREGGPGTPLDGSVHELGTNSDGSVLAIFTARGNGSTCLSIRESDGDWRPIIEPALLEVDGEDLVAAIDGLPMPLLLCREGEPRLLTYQSATRMLQPAPIEQGAARIAGEFTDWCEGRTGTGDPCAYLLTSGSGGGIYRIRTSFSERLAVEPLGVPGNSATLIAIGPAGDGGVVVIGSDGRAWHYVSGTANGWNQLRAGSQDLALDKVESAAFSHSGTRLWIVRNGEVWTRAIPKIGAPPADPKGWSRLALPSTDPLVDHERLLIAESAVPDEIVLVRTAGELSERTGHALRLTLTADGLQSSTLLESGDRILDADSIGHVVVLHIGEQRQIADAPIKRRLDIIDLAGPGPLRRKTVRSWSQPEIPDPAELDQPVLAYGASGDSSIALFRSGRFIRFDPTMDRLLPAINNGPSVFGSVHLRSDAVDGAIDLSGPPATAFVLGARGHVEAASLAGPAVPEPRLVIDPDDSIPSLVAETATYAVTDSNGAILASAGSLWEFSSLDAADHWIDRSTELGGSDGVPVASFDIDGTPVVAWSGSDAGRARILRSKKVVPVDNLDPVEIRPGLRQAFFVHLESEGALYALSGEGRANPLLPAQTAGPPEVVASTIRSTSIDFLSRDRLHSVSIPDGIWHSSAPFGAGYRLSVVPGAGGDGLLVVPEDSEREGKCFAVGAGQQADELSVLGGGVNLRSAMPFAGGVVGLAGSDLAWLSAAGAPPSRIEDRSNPTIDLARVEEAIAFDRRVVLRGRAQTGGPSTIVSYPTDHGRASKLEGRNFTAVEPGTDAIMALDQDARKVFALDPVSLVPKAEWPIMGRVVALGRNQGGNPAIAVDGSIFRLEGPQPRELLVAGSISEGKPPLYSAAFDRSLVLFSEEGAWIREADPTRSFRKIPEIGGTPELVRFSPSGGYPWIREGGLWKRLDQPKDLVGSIGWTVNGTEVRLDNVANPMPPMVAGKVPATFLPAPFELGMPMFVESLGPGHALLIGDRGAGIFDAHAHCWRERGSLLRAINGKSEVISRRSGQVRVRLSDGRAMEIDSAGERWLFAEAPIRAYVESPMVLAMSATGQLLDEQGNAIIGVPPIVAGQPSTVTGAVAHGDSILRIVDGAVERFRLDSMRVERIADVRGDAIAQCGEAALVFDRGRKCVTSIGRNYKLGVEQVERWFPSTRQTALERPSGDIEIQSPDGLRLAHVAASPLPGRLLGNIPNSASSLVETAPDTFALFDVLAGKTLITEVRGRDPQIGPDAIYLTDLDGNQVLRIDASGRQSVSESFSQVILRANPSAAICYAVRESATSYEVFELDPRSLKPGPPKFVRKALLPAGEASPAPLVARAVLGGRLTILITKDLVVLDDGSHTTHRPNPLKSASANAYWVNGRVILESQDGRAAALAAFEHGRLRLIDDARVEVAAGTRLKTLFGPSWMRVPIATEVFAQRAPFRGSFIDIATGWIEAEQPVRIESADGLAIRFADQSMFGPVGPLPSSARPALTEPLSEARGQLQYRLDGDTVRLGKATPHERFQAHGTRAFAPVGDGACVRIDELGQLWISDSRGSHYIASQVLTRFSISTTGELHVHDDAGGTYLVGQAIGSGGTLVRVGVLPELLPDATLVIGRCGAIGWSWSSPQPKGGLVWTLRDRKGVQRSLTPTTSGFAELSEPQLVIAEGNAAVRMAGAHGMVAPILKGAIDWERLSFDAVASPPPDAMPLATEARLDGNWSISRRNGDGLMVLRLGDREFEFDAIERRFASTICHTVTAMQDRAITATAGGSAILAWSIAADGAVGDPTLIAPPNGDRVVRLAPGESSDSFVAELSDGEGHQRQMKWSAGQWTGYAQATSVASTGAQWGWNRQGAIATLAGQVSYRLVEGHQPLLECDMVSFDPTGRPSDSLRTVRNGCIQYRGVNGQWFEVSEGQMPRPIDQPAEIPTQSAVGELRFERWPVAGTNTPACAVQLSDGLLPVELCIEDGILRDLDGWSADPLVAGPGGEMFVASASTKTSRCLAVVGDEIRLGAPSRRHIPYADPARRVDPFQNVREAFGFALSEQHHLQYRSCDLGLPGRRGFDTFDPDPHTMLPLGFTENGKLVVSVRGRIISLDPAQPLTTVELIESGVPLNRTAWESNGAAALFVGYSSDGEVPQKERREQIDPHSFRRTSLGAMPVAHLHSFATPNELSIEVTRDAAGLHFTRRGAEPLSMALVPQSGAGRLAFEHLAAQRIDVRPDGLRTYSSSAVARYVRSGNQLRLASVVANSADKSTARVTAALNGGLWAHRAADDGNWTLRLGGQSNAPSWPLSSLIGPDRVYVGECGRILEASERWTRVVNLSDGTVDARSPDGLGCRLADPSTYRSATVLVANGERFEIGDGCEVKSAPSTMSIPPLGFVNARSDSGWTLSLPARGAICELAFAGEPLGVRDGALPMDIAISVAPDPSSIVVVDRLGVEHAAGIATDWRRHGLEHRGVMAAAIPSRLLGVDVGTGVRRVLRVSRDDSPLSFLLPMAPGEELGSVRTGEYLDSWALGNSVEIRLETSGMVRLARIDGQHRRYDYTPVLRAQACEVGRLAFDIPQELGLARIPGLTSVEACVVMRSGCEWPDPETAGGVRAVSGSVPRLEEPEFGPVARPEWLARAGLGPSVPASIIEAAGEPIIWYPFGERLFLVGERNVIWLELGWRWRGRDEG